MEIKSHHTPEEAIAKVLMAARDPDLDGVASSTPATDPSAAKVVPVSTAAAAAAVEKTPTSDKEMR
jgi:hypothetical protein